MPRVPASVLIVDDQPANLLALEAVLGDLAADLVPASSGEQALEKLQGGDFAAVLLDVRMPGMSGFEVARRIRAQPRHHATPILFITADESDLAVREAYALGAVDFLAKPIVPAVLRSKVAIFVELFESREEVRASRDERLRLAAEAAGLGVWVWEPDDDRVTWEHQWLFDLFGLPPGSEAINAQRFEQEFVHPDDRELFARAAQATLERGQPFQFQGRIRRQSDRSLRWVEFRGRLQPTQPGRPRQVLGTATDISERKAFEQRLAASEELYRTLFESIDEGFCVIEMLFDAQGRAQDYRFLEANRAFAAQSGLGNPVGRRMRELAPELEEHWYETYGTVARTGEPVRFVNEARTLGRWFDVYATRIGGAGSVRVALLFTDITERRRADQALRTLADELAESDRRKTEFLATLAHELRNPLAPLTNGLQLLRMAGDKPEVAQRTRQMMERQVHHMVHLVDDLLDIARVTTGKVELRRQPIDLRAAVHSAVETSAPLVEAGRHTLEVALPDEALTVFADPTRVTQVVSNLLNNAAKYTPAGGRIRLQARREGQEAVLAVSDNGVGIAPEALGRVFEMFAQVPGGPGRPQGGLGIGLSLVQSLVGLHGGRVTVDSEGPGRGSTFTVRLPLHAKGAATTADPAGQAPPAAAGRRILVVDDNRDAAESLASLLALLGHQTRVGHDGAQALALAEAFDPEVLFLDIGLPDMSGNDVARRLRERPAMKGRLLVALTGWGTQEDRQRTREAGFDHHLTKPAELSAVEAILSGLARTPAP